MIQRFHLWPPSVRISDAQTGIVLFILHPSALILCIFWLPSVRISNAQKPPHIPNRNLVRRCKSAKVFDLSRNS
jgi:hypothetical protein